VANDTERNNCNVFKDAVVPSQTQLPIRTEYIRKWLIIGFVS
jgi:hypothetical protein